MIHVTQQVFPTKTWVRVTAYVSPKDAGNCLGIQLHEGDSSYTISIHSGKDSPADLIRKIYIAITDLRLQMLEEEENK